MKQNIVYEKILGVLYGQAYGDAMGMPGELWPQSRVRHEFGWINTFLPGHPENIAANGFAAGQFTDDTEQAIAVIKALIEDDGGVHSETIAKHILAWAESIDAFNKNILGPSSKSTLLQFKNGIPLEDIIANGVTNGAVMRVAPIGCLLPSNDFKRFSCAAYCSAIVTHKSDVAIAGATTIAWIISQLISGSEWEPVIVKACDLANQLQIEHSSTFVPLLGHRIEYALQVIEKARSKQEIVSLIYNYIGTGMDVIETVPAALALAKASRLDIVVCGELAANLGGDSDTIGAIAGAVCGAHIGISGLPTAVVEQINLANDIDFSQYAEKLTAYRERYQQDDLNG